MDTPRNLAIAVLALLLAGCASSGQPSATDVMVEFEAQKSLAYHPRVTARWPIRIPKLPPTQLLIVRLPGQSPLLGAFETTDNTVTFTPRFPLLANQRYEAAVLPDGPKVSYTTPASTGSAPRIIAIHPTTDALPANHLKFYLQFSEPMEQGGITRHFKLLDANGREVPEPFRDTELWSNDGRRLTLWFHPGRQKTGVNLNVDLGPVLMEDVRYTLVIDDSWKSQAGRPLGITVKKPFRALAADRSQPDPKQWQLTTPQTGTREPLTLRFNEPLDWALLHTQLTVENVSGKSTVINSEREWRFTPNSPWKHGRHQLLVGWELEDLAGNNLKSLFEVDLRKAPATGLDHPKRVPFFVN
ncbi:MAG: hypothetical protein QF600_00845 [Verrucomicrobiota bacterium]|nr:hypothetical protein [Verrucomicrobiota bacterium]